MEENFYNDEFEQFLQQQANNHRMYPTDGVWLGIYKKLHGHKKWPALTISAFTILIATVATSLYFSPKPSIFALPENTTVLTQQRTTHDNKLPLVNLAVVDKQMRGSNLVNQTDPLTSVAQREIATHQLVGSKPVPNTIQQVEVAKNNELPGNERLFAESDRVENKHSVSTRRVDVEAVQTLTNSLAIAEYKNELHFDGPVSKNVVTAPRQANNQVKQGGDFDDKNIADNFLQEHNNDVSLYTTNKLISRKKRFSYTIYVAPSASYRKLKENEELNRKSTNITGPVAANFVTDVNKLVRHKPGTGFEAGIAFTYHLSNTLGLKTGLQFNVRQYNIEAYRSSTELTAIALLSNSGIDTITTYAVYRNSNGNTSTELINRYFQISLPVGIEWEVFGGRKVKFNIAANIQPTYNLNRNSYVLTTNFKNYTTNSGMLRNWNINSSVEAFMSVKLGEYRWQLGPQFRYQNLSTFIKEYPIQENLMDYGFKIGVSRVIK